MARDGETPRFVACNNVVFNAALVTGQDLRFDPLFNLSGGEDFDFFEASRRLGNGHVWTGAAQVNEHVPAGRATLGALFYRHFTGAVTRVMQHRKWHGRWSAWPRFLLKAAGKGLGGVLELLCLPLPDDRPRLRNAVKKFGNGAGYLCGLCGIRHRRYGRDGSP